MMMEEKMVMSSSFGGTRKRLSDITNLQSQISSPANKKENTPAFDDSYAKNYIEKLLKENAAMMKLIQERDKVIESNGLEMQKLRVIVQKSQLQNWHLAQSNSQMLAELNMGKDRLKALQHELACKDALFKAKIVELEENAKMQWKPNDLQERETTSKSEAVDQLQDNNNNKSKMARNKNTCHSRSQSMGPITSQRAADKEMAENKRRCLRRLSVRLKQHEEPQGDLLEIDIANTPISHQSQSKPSSATRVEEGHQESSNAAERRRSSLRRPLRSATVKVQSYKETSLVSKMRRP